MNKDKNTKENKINIDKSNDSIADEKLIPNINDVIEKDNNNEEININDNKDNTKEGIKEESKKTKKNKKKKKGKIFLAILIIFLIGLICAGTIFGYKVYKNGGGMQGVLATVVGHDENTLKNMPKIYCLVTGQSQNLTDTIMVCSYDPKTQEASILSIPRDTFIGTSKRSANSYDKINALYQSGPEKTLATVNELTGLNIKYYLNVDTSALRQLVDSIGGVYFDVPIDMDYDDGEQDLYIHLKKGYQLLDGDKAEQVVRFRHNNDGTSYPTEYGDNDIGRMRTQREFIMAVIKKLATPSTLMKVNDLIKIADRNVTTNLDLSLAKDYAPYAIKFNVENLQTDTLPGTPELYNSIWFYSQNVSETKKVVKKLFGTDEEQDEDEEDIEDDETLTTKNNKNTKSNTTSKSTNTTTNSTKKNTKTNTTTTKETEITEEQKIKNSKIRVEILNGTSDSAKLSNLKEVLKKNGYNVTKTGITTNTSKTTIINRTEKNVTVVEDLKIAIEENGVVLSGSDNSNVDFTIIIGQDMKLKNVQDEDED